MKSTIRPFAILFFSILLFSNCAKRGRPTGGPKDSIPPVIIRSNPENFTTNFTGDEIRIYFDEYIKLNKLKENLIISPPLKYDPIISPTGTAKILKIKIRDTLLQNTTYSFNFGKSIVDNNEQNEFEYYKYIFSTGSYIDSLTITGKIEDALLVAPDKPATVMLYERTDNFSDSLIYSEKPTYIARTKDSTHTFSLNNLKEGNYMLIALQEELNNYTFEPSKDKIGFVDAVVSTPTDSNYTIKLFKESPDYKITRPSHVSKNLISFGFEGNADSLQVTPISKIPDDFTSFANRYPLKDSLNYWFKPAIDVEQIDTILFIAENRNMIDTLPVRMRDLFADSLKVTRIGSSNIIPRDSLRLQVNTPLVSIDNERIKVYDKDTTELNFETIIDHRYSIASIIFDKTDENQYRVEILPDAFKDFFENTNDTLKYGLNTKAVADYGTLNLRLEKAVQFPMIVELVDNKFKVVTSTYLSENKEVYYDYLSPGKYYLRIIYDENGNEKWDSGNFLKKVQPEMVIYYPTIIEIRPNWSLNEIFTLE